jgi:hypothetical protein
MDSLSWRGTAVSAFLLLQTLVVLITEVLSVGRHLTTATVTIAWITADIMLICALLGTIGMSACIAMARSRPSAAWSWLRRQPVDVALGVACLVAVTVVVKSVIGITAWLYLPTNGEW